MKEVKHEHAKVGKRVNIWLIIFLCILFVIHVKVITPMFKGSFLYPIVGNIPLIILGIYLYRRFKRKSIKTDDKVIKNSDPLELLLNGKVNIKNPYSGIFISGGAGSGKSKSLIEPIIYDAGNKNFTGVVYDFKYPELARYVETAFDSSKIDKRYVNFTDMNFTDRINPIEPGLMRNDSYAREFALSILANLNPTMISKPDFGVITV